MIEKDRANGDVKSLQATPTVKRVYKKGRW